MRRWGSQVFLTLFFVLQFLTQPLEATCLAGGKIIIVFIEASDFDCHLCLEGLVTFCEKWKQSKSDVLTLGIYTPPTASSNKDGARRQDISKKRLEGFIKGYSSIFPIITDQNHTIMRLHENKIDVLVIDTLQRTLKSYKYPLYPQDWEDIFSGSEKRKEEL